MAKIHINNPKQVINGGAKKYYFKVKGLGGPKGDKGDTGATGPQGPQGPQGNAATVSVGSTTTLPVGYDATVENVGSIYNAVLNFGIPQGPRGPQGATGAKGDKGDKGDQGNPGPQGEKGTNATVYVGTTSTLNPGSQATVYNSGTDSNAVLNFGIPKGEKGDTGPMPTIAQSTGQAADQVMSQKATTDALNTKQATITSSNKLSADLVDDTSTTNKFVTASDITNWNAKQDALTAGTGIDITSDVISTPALVPEVVASLPAEGAESKLYLTPKAHTSQTASGNPIEATITAQAGQLESFQLDGDTFQQSYTGKNLLNLSASRVFTSGTDYSFDASSGVLTVTMSSAPAVNRYSGWRLTGITAGAKYTFSVESFTNSALSNTDRAIMIRSHNGTSALELATLNKTQTSYTFTAPNDSVRLDFFFYIASGDTDSTSIITKPMLEAGETVTAYEPFVGGQPSPSPDYPQQIQTVTGLQTITINGTDYPLDLGTIELCRIEGKEQPLVFDYIYKDGDSWKVHKALGKQTIVGSDIQLNSSYSNVQFATVPKPSDSRIYGNYTAIFIYNDHAIYRYNSGGWNNSDLDHGVFTTPNQERYWFGYPKGTSLETMQSELNGAITYYALATPTDTVITNSNLIAQLEAIRTASLQNGTNTITNTATGTNLAGDMEIGYYGFNPTNRYDKFIWLDLNNNYEQIGG